MKRSVLNLLVDMLSAAVLAGLIATGYILRFALPPRTNRTHELWGLSRHEWGGIHFWISVALIAVVFVHIALHWEWIVSMVLRRFGKAANAVTRRTLRAGVMTGLVLLTLGGLFAWAAHGGVRELARPEHPIDEPDARAPMKVDFQADIQVIFEVACLDCHGPVRSRGNFRVDRRADFYSSGELKPLIVPGNAEESRLIAIVSGKVVGMRSAEAHILPPREIALLKAWINGGAEWPEVP